MFEESTLEGHLDLGPDSERRADRRVAVFSGNANRPLAEEVCELLNIKLGNAEVFEFPNENIFVKINQVVREYDVFVIQSFTRPVSRSIMELFIMLDALKRASAARITAVIPYFAYGRTDKKDHQRVPITARLLANLIERAGATHVVTMDLHAGQIQGFFDVPCDETTAEKVLADHFNDLKLPNAVVVSPDLGFAKRARNFAERLAAPLAIIEKRRVGHDSTSEALRVIGDVRGGAAIIIDDEIDTAGSMLNAALAVKEAGAQAVYVCCVHPIFSPPAVDRLLMRHRDTGEPVLARVVVTNTAPIAPEARERLGDKLQVLSVAQIFAAAIQRIHAGGSIGAMFQLPHR